VIVEEAGYFSYFDFFGVHWKLWNRGNCA
jgi:hypothetical protein